MFNKTQPEAKYNKRCRMFAYVVVTTEDNAHIRYSLCFNLFEFGDRLRLLAEHEPINNNAHN